MKKIFKNKKGSTVVETVILFPIIFYVILFATFKVITYLQHSNATEHVTSCTRIASTASNLEDAFKKIASINYQNENGNIVKMELQNPKNLFSYELFFGKNENEALYLKKYYKNEDSNGIPEFDYVSLKNEGQEAVVNIEKNWGKGMILKLYYENDLAKDTSLDKMLHYTYYDFSSGTKYNNSFGINTVVYANASAIIQNS